MIFWIPVRSTCVFCHVNTWPVAVEVMRCGGEGSVDTGDKAEI